MIAGRSLVRSLVRLSPPRITFMKQKCKSTSQAAAVCMRPYDVVSELTIRSLCAGFGRKKKIVNPVKRVVAAQSRFRANSVRAKAL